MEDLIKTRLDEMRDLKDRTVLRDTLNDVFLALYVETERKYEALEQRVRDELPLIYERYTVYCTALKRGSVDSGHICFSPMIKKELDEPVFSARDLTSALEDNAQPVIGTVFYEADSIKCKQRDFTDRIYSGALEADSKRYPFKCRLRPAKRYTGLVEKLYRVFLQNDMPWTTVNCSYLSKFFDVHIISLPEAPPPRTIIRQDQIHVSFEPYDQMTWQDIIPVWNIDVHNVKGDDFPMPAIDNVNYEYRFDISKLGAENGFLVDFDSAFILSARRDNDSVVAVSPQPRELTWDIYRFRKHFGRAVDTYPYPVLSNARIDTFAARLTAERRIQVKTKAELRGLVAAFEAASDIELRDISFAGEKFSGETYDMNQFIKDELRDPEFKRTLTLKFSAKKRDHFLTRDNISFLTSQVQIAFPEYNCVGILI